MKTSITSASLATLLGEEAFDPRPQYSTWGSDYFDRMKGELLFHLNTVRRYVSEPQAKILDVGAYLGHASIALRKLGYTSLYAVDVPEYTGDPYLAERFRRFGIALDSYRAGTQPIPHPGDLFDCVLFTEILEHLTANPFDVADELRRVLKPGGHLVVSTPNQAWLYTRAKILLGGSWWPLEEFERERDPRNDMRYGHHWHEYTLTGLSYLLERSGFAIVEAAQVNYPKADWGKDFAGKRFRSLRKAFFYAAGMLGAVIPSLRYGLYAVGRKR